MRIKVGDKVSVARWDASEPPDKRLISPAEVISIHKGEPCETGTMVWLRGKSGRKVFLDLN